MAEKVLYLSREDVEAVGVQMSEIIETLDVILPMIFILNLGVALDDMTTASLIYHRALAQGIGRMLPL